MSEEIEEILNKKYICRIEVELYKGIYGKYEIKVYLTPTQGFKFVYNYIGYFTKDKNIDNICEIIDGMIVDYYRKREVKKNAGLG